MTVPTTDERLHELLHDAASQPDIDGVAERVHAKRQHRRAVRRIQTGAAAVAVIAGVTIAGVTLIDTGGGRQVAVPPVERGAPVVRVAAGAPGAAAGRRAAS